MGGSANPHRSETQTEGSQTPGRSACVLLCYYRERTYVATCFCNVNVSTVIEERCRIVIKTVHLLNFMSFFARHIRSARVR